jgi:hypothetical protein
MTMRVLAIAIGAVVVAAGVIVILWMTVDRPAGETGSYESIELARLENLEQNLRETRWTLDILTGEVEAIQDNLTALGERTETGEPPHAAPPVPDVPEHRASAREPSPPEPEDSPGLRRIVREEIERAEEERKKKQQEEWKARQPEDWEKEEFKEYAWQVHSTGNKLDLTDNQKRQYYTIIKEHAETTRSLWKELREKNPGGDWKQLSKEYQERSKEMLKTTRDMVLNLLNAAQQKKYKKFCKDSQWFK